MARIVTRAMRRRPLVEWPLTCGLACPTGPLTLDAIGQLLGCSREMVRQLEERAMAKLMAAARKRYRGETRVADFIGTGDGV